MQNVGFHPCVFGYGEASCPGSLTFHLEHTLFPGVCYTHLPIIAPVVEQTCKEFGLDYPKIKSYADLLTTFNGHLAKYSGKGIDQKAA